MNPLTHTGEDEVVVEAQIGRAPRGRWRVAKRCHLGVPMVIESYPRLDDGSPFPTLYWLTCPILVKRTSTLESDGTMHALNDLLDADPALRERFAIDVRAYRAERDAHEVLEGPPSVPGGGPDRVKCLHAHLAHELVTSNVVGARALAATGWPDCRVPCVEAAV